MVMPLEGIKVVDMGRAQQGPFAAALLADMGADVIKVESLTGDFTRGVFLTSWYPEGTVDAYCLAMNRGKRSLSIDYHTAKGREVVLKLAERADVFMHNFRSGVVDSIGLGYNEVNRLNPRIIYAHITGYGRNNSLAFAPAFDLIGQAMGGIMSVTGDADGPPTPVGAAIGDQVGAIMSALGIMTALFVRDRTGIGQEVDVSMMDSQLALQTWEITHYLVKGELPPKAGRGHGLLPGVWLIFKCKDNKWIAVAGCQDPRFPGFCRALGVEHLLTDPRFDTAEKREKNRDQLVPILDEVFAQRIAEEWLERLHQEDQVVGLVWDYTDIVRSPYIEETNMLVTLDHRSGQKVRTVGNPIKLSKTPLKVRAGDPEVGQNTEEILLELGYSWEDITALGGEGVI